MFIDRRVVEALVDHKWHIAFTGSRSHYDRHFREHFGVPPEMVAALWNQVSLEPNSDNMRPEDVLWALYFLRQNPTECWGPILPVRRNHISTMCVENGQMSESVESGKQTSHCQINIFTN